MDKLKLDDREKTLLMTIKAEIEAIVDNKIHSIYKLAPHSHINQKAVENDSKELFFKELERKIQKDIELCSRFYEQLKLDDPSLYNKIKERLEKNSDQLANLKTLHDLKEVNEKNLSKEELDKVYHVGVEWFKKEDYDKSLLYFTYLSLVDAENPQVWVSKGMAEQNLGKQEEALNSYMISITLAPYNLVPYLQIMDTLILMKKFTQAHQIYELFMREVDPEEYSHNAFLMSKLNTIREFLKKVA